MTAGIIAAVVCCCAFAYGVWRRVAEQASLRAYCREHGHAWDKDIDGELWCLRCTEPASFQPWRRYLGE